MARALLGRAADPPAAAGGRLAAGARSWGEPDAALHAASRQPGTVTASATVSSRGGPLRWRLWARV